MKKTILFLMTMIASISLSAANIKTKIALNWKPEPEFGGFYEGLTKGIYNKNGFEVEILEGGSGTPTPQMLMSGQIDYAIVSSEEILLNNDRDPKRRLTAVYSVFEKSPYMVMSHADTAIKNLKDIFQNKNMTISLQKGLPYVEFLMQKYAPIRAQIVPYSGGIAVFEKNKNLAQQGFITSEFLIAQNQKLDPKAWLVADEGFNPYIAVLAVREDFLAKNKDQVQKMVIATREAWASYLASPEATNKLMHEKNPSMSAEMMNRSLVKMKDLMKFEPLKLGQMQKERWLILGLQMQKLKLISKPIETDKIFQDF